MHPKSTVVLVTLLAACSNGASPPDKPPQEHRDAPPVFDAIVSSLQHKPSAYHPNPNPDPKAEAEMAEVMANTAALRALLRIRTEKNAAKLDTAIQFLIEQQCSNQLDEKVPITELFPMERAKDAAVVACGYFVFADNVRLCGDCMRNQGRCVDSKPKNGSAH